MEAMYYNFDNQYGALIGRTPPCPFELLLGTIKVCIKLRWITPSLIQQDINPAFVPKPRVKLEKWFGNCRCGRWMGKDFITLSKYCGYEP